MRHATPRWSASIHFAVRLAEIRTLPSYCTADDLTAGTTAIDRHLRQCRVLAIKVHDITAPRHHGTVPLHNTEALQTYK
jgi:hypothetical protein